MPFFASDIQYGCDYSEALTANFSKLLRDETIYVKIWFVFSKKKLWKMINLSNVSFFVE